MISSDARILVVDDDPLLLDLLVDTLQVIGYEATSATNGLHALDRLQESRFDLVITDIKMPEMDGLDLLKKVRHRYPEIPVLFITGVASPEIIGMAEPDGLLAKPFRISHVEELIENALSQKSAIFKRSTSRVLILDNDENSRQSMSDSLAVSRYLPFAVADNEAALKEIDNGHIDAFIASVDPSASDGEKLLSAVRTRRPKMPLIVLDPKPAGRTGDRESSDPRIDGYFNKPVTAKQVISLLDQIIPNIN